MVGRTRIHLFATAREAVGVGEIAWSIPPDGVSLHGLVQELGNRYRRLRPILPTCRLFVNGELVRASSRRLVKDGDEIAVHPPYSGG